MLTFKQVHVHCAVPYCTGCSITLTVLARSPSSRGGRGVVRAMNCSRGELLGAGPFMKEGGVLSCRRREVNAGGREG